jgi:two-component system LytT family response regulator
MLELVENPPGVIFTTAFEEFAIKAFETHAIDYLLKPFGKERFDKAIQKALLQKPVTQATQAVLETAALSPAQNNRIVVKDGVKIKIIPVAQVQYLEAADDYVKIFTTEGCFLKKKTMTYFEQFLKQELFVRIHRSYIINVQLITRIDLYEKDSHVVLLTNGMRLPVSKSRLYKVKRSFGHIVTFYLPGTITILMLSLSQNDCC